MSTETYRTSADTDPEITAIRTVIDVLEPLTVPERARVLSRLMIRYSVPGRPLGAAVEPFPVPASTEGAG